jgi:outer membrane protein OmpA-like peptidoglycan-associated protein
MVFVISCNDNTTHSQVIDDNNKAVKLEEEGKYAEALKYYKKALDIDPKHSTVWLGVGDVYYKQKQLPLSFEAYLHACKGEKDALKIAEKLYHEDRYKTIDDQNQFNEESLSLLLDAKRMKKIDIMLKACLGNTKSTIIVSETKPEVIFRNIHFETGKAIFKGKQAIQSLRTLAAVWNKYNPKHMILIKGHTDSQQYRNDRKNWKLSVDRAFTVSDILVGLKIPITCIGIAGYGYGIPAKNSKINDFDKNRRVEIEILSRKCII